jgi:hypothetical protein
MIEAGSLVGLSADDLEEHGAETGLVLEYQRGTTPPAKIQPNTIPTGLDRIGQKAADNIKSISGINDSMLGTDSAEVSGVAIQAKQNRGVIMIQVPLDNLKKTRQILAEKILNLVQSFYTEQRIIQVTNEDDPLKPREPMVINEQTPEGKIINDLTLGEYDVIVATAPARDSFDEIQFAEAINLRNVGVQIPDDAVVEYSHLARKGELAKRIRVLTGQEPPTPEQAEMQQQHHQWEMESIQLEIAKLEAEVRKLQSEAAVNTAKVQDIADVQPNLKVNELERKIALKQEEFELRRGLSERTNELRAAQSESQAASKIAATVIQQSSRNNPTQ